MSEKDPPHVIFGPDSKSVKVKVVTPDTAEEKMMRLHEKIQDCVDSSNLMAFCLWKMLVGDEIPFKTVQDKFEYHQPGLMGNTQRYVLDMVRSPQYKLTPEDEITAVECDWVGFLTEVLYKQFGGQESEEPSDNIPQVLGDMTQPFYESVQSLHTALYELILKQLGHKPEEVPPALITQVVAYVLANEGLTEGKTFVQWFEEASFKISQQPPAAAPQTSELA